MTNFLKSFLSIFLVSLFLSFFVANASMAANFQLDSFANKAGYSTTGTKASLESLIQIVINVILSLTGILFLILAVYAGVRWMSAQGNAEDVTKAKETLQAAIIGMVIVSMSYAVTTLVFNTLQNKIPTNPSTATSKGCISDGDCGAGEKCTPLGVCYSNNCSDPINQCGGGCTPCANGFKCSTLADCVSGNCNNNMCVSANVDPLNCAQYKTDVACISACFWNSELAVCEPQP